VETNQIKQKLRIVSLAVSIAALTGCAAPTLYLYGHYEELIYVSYAAPGKVSPERMCRGWHAHLGHLYFQLGKMDQAQQEFLTEKAEFPESAVFMDRLLANLKKQ
jgi:hypothetical protein